MVGEEDPVEKIVVVKASKKRKKIIDLK
jgi:hypothetical protein